ncbi:MAG: SDR family oxidoreductase [Xanthobacteraceae bacterium]|nr:SDR family oxidoreductase [Xanthobacteraceae bacterium]QYK43992.1 MAG: SDR family oxidoreductase [Xanthobacteraceae bacterium]
MAASRKIALVTGAGSGIGKASAVALAKAGFNVAIAGRTPAPLEETAKEIKAAGGEALVVPTDVGDPAQVKALFAKIKEKFGRLDVIFNNAGRGTPPVPLEEVKLEDWNATVAANLTGPFVCTQEAFKIMKDQNPRGGRIINNGSISAYAPRPFSAPYTSTKHAISGLTRATALDGRAYDIACSQIDIGNAVTPMTERMANGVLQPDGTTKVEPRVAVEHVANAIVYIASLPLDANVLFMNVMATKMPFVGRG